MLRSSIVAVVLAFAASSQAGCIVHNHYHQEAPLPAQSGGAPGATSPALAHTAQPAQPAHTGYENRAPAFEPQPHYAPADPYAEVARVRVDSQCNCGHAQEPDFFLDENNVRQGPVTPSELANNPVDWLE
tara:strand:- start:11580 stop:11969 length:390 start_codon:yes stop_codon:yes gene_type:complete